MSNIAVIYPDVSDPYRKIFNDTIKGMEDRSKSNVTRIVLKNNNQSQQETLLALQRAGIKTAVTFGKDAYLTVATTNMDLRIVPAFILNLPEIDKKDGPVVSLVPEPDGMFQIAKSMSPGLKRVYTVYSKQSEWLIKLAKEQIKGMELIAYEVKDSKSAARAFNDILTSAKPDQDAVWLLQDSIAIDDEIVLPMIIEESWTRNIMVFSNSITHVKKGALFSLTPDYTLMGGTLADIANGNSSNNTNTPRALPLREATGAINIRMSDHLRIILNNQINKLFKRSFPEP